MRVSRVGFQQRELLVSSTADLFRKRGVCLPEIRCGAMNLNRLNAAVLFVGQSAANRLVQTACRQVGLHASIDGLRMALVKPRIQLAQLLRRQRIYRTFDFLKRVQAPWPPPFILGDRLPPHHINVNVVDRTFTRTDLVAGMLADPKFYDALVARIPLGRIAEPGDVRNAVLFLASPASDFITGQTLYLDGGITATQ
jgi:Enoyl-(Acyl carrier protein) reductase